MRIKRIEIIGFKSFCDRAVLNINTPITSIVGPNGCGKSNIVDAIRWCMGEQSAKHLRGKAMDDVIFAGSETRGPAAMAEVSLTFEDVGFSHEALELHLREVTARASADSEGSGDDADAGAVQGLDPATSETTGEPNAVQASAGADTSVAAEIDHEAEAATDAATEAAADTVDVTAAADTSADVGAAASVASVVNIADAVASTDADADTDTDADTATDAIAVEAAVGAKRAAKAMEPDDVVDPAGEEILDEPSATEQVEAFLEDRPPAFDFARYTEVTITRRLFRDGTSHYMINKTPCRLRDVTDFFLGTGIGTKAYAIIEQGRIGMIVSARPQERRTLIEEAAGITKFKSKKRAAERKLEQTRHNLLRVSDIVSELEKRMGSLRRQAQKAERYRRYKADIRDIELWKAAHRFLALRAQQKLLEHSLAEYREELHTARTELAAEETKIIAERTELTVEERRLSGLQEAIYEFENRITLWQNKIEFQTREADELEERVVAARSEIETLSERRTEAVESLEHQRGELETLSEQAEREEFGVHARELSVNEARQMLANAQSQLDEARAQLAAARSELAVADSRRESLERNREEAKRRHERIVADTEVVEQRVKTVDKDARVLDKKLAELKQTHLDLGSQFESLHMRREHLEETVQGGEARVESLRAELQRRTSRLQSLREIHDKYEGFARGTRAIMQASDELSASGHGIRGLVADMVTAPASLEIAVEAALGEQLGGVLVASHEASLRAVQYLKEHASGRSVFVPYDSVSALMDRSLDAGHSPATVSLTESATVSPSDGDTTRTESRPGVLGRMAELVTFEPSFARMGRELIGAWLVVDTLERAIELHQAGETSLMVTLDGDIVNPSGVILGGSRESQGASVLAQKREIRELEDTTERLALELTEATAHLTASKSELQQVTRALEGLRKESHQGELAIMSHDKDATQCHIELERLRERLTHLNAEQLDLEERMGKAEGELGDSAAIRARATERIDHFEREQLGFIQGVTDGRAQTEELSQLLTEAKIRSAQLGEKRASLQASALQLEAMDRELGARISKLSEDIIAGTERGSSLRTESQSLREQLEEVRIEWREKSEELNTGRSAYEMRLADIQVAEVAVREIRVRADKLAAKANDAKLHMGQAIASRQVLEETVSDRYQLAIASHVGDYHLRPLVTKDDEERLAELKRLIERMGPDINLTAIDEYAEVSERHEFLHGQRDDLQNAVDQLEKAIAKINKTSRRLFRDTFNAINSQFQEVFPRLFRGGRAKLRLTAPKNLAEGEDFDILDAGVDIMAQPPGKKNTTVEQLSGGEKALTAVALIFSIFLVKPSPFCILDEVDAPLDDANVDRYNEFVRSMTDRSQFIVITHNKRTMEIADNLYGVTMQEPGVSKLVAVNLSKISARVAA